MRLCVCLPDWVFVYLRVCVCLSDRVQRQEREVMLKLKQVVDKQRDELRAKVQENATISKEVEAVRHKHLFFFKLFICSSRSLEDRACFTLRESGQISHELGH